MPDRTAPVTAENLRERIDNEIAFHLGYRSSRATDAVLAVVTPELERLQEERDAARLVSKGRTMEEYDRAEELERLRAELAETQRAVGKAIAKYSAAKECAEKADAELQRIHRAITDTYGEDYAGDDVATEVERLLGHLAEHEAHVMRILQAKNEALEKAQAERDTLTAAITAALEERQRHIREFHPTRLVDPSCAGCRIGLVLSREMPARIDTPEELDLLFRVTRAETAIRRLEALCKRALADDGTRFEDPMPLPGWVTLIQNALRPPTALDTPGGPDSNEDAPTGEGEAK